MHALCSSSAILFSQITADWQCKARQRKRTSDIWQSRRHHQLELHTWALSCQALQLTLLRSSLCFYCCWELSWELSWVKISAAASSIIEWYNYYHYSNLLAVISGIRQLTICIRCTISLWCSNFLWSVQLQFIMFTQLLPFGQLSQLPIQLS